MKQEVSERLASLRATRACKLAALECEQPMSEGEKAAYKIGFNDGVMAMGEDMEARIDALLRGEKT